MVRQPGVPAIHERVVQVRLEYPALEIVEDDPAWDRPEEGERAQVAVDPGGGIHTPHDGDKHVPRERQHHDERVQDHAFARHWIDPFAEPAVIDLRLFAGWWVVTSHRNAWASSVG